MDLFDKGQLTEQEAIAMLEQLEVNPPFRSVLAPTLTPVPIPDATKRPTPTPTTRPQEETDEEDRTNCDWDFVPVVTSIEWLAPPKVSVNGDLSLKGPLGEGDKLTIPNQPGGGYSNVALTNGRGRLYGAVDPPAPPGTTWTPTPGQWIADTYHLDRRLATASARIDTRVAIQADLTLCLWTGGRVSANRILDCIQVV